MAPPRSPNWPPRACGQLRRRRHRDGNHGRRRLAQIAAAGIRAFCAVDQNGVAQDASTADQFAARGIRPRVLLDATGVALNGSAGQAVLASRGLQSFCPVDESGNATTM